MLKKQGETWKSGLNNGECKERMIRMADNKRSEIIKMLNSIQNYTWLCLIHSFVSGFFEVLQEKRGAL